MIKLMDILNEARRKQAVVGGKVQRFITGYGVTIFGKKYEEVEFELVSIDNGRGVVTLRIDSPKEISGRQVEISFKFLRRGPFMATDIPNAF